MAILNEISPETTARKVEDVGKRYRDAVITESAVSFDKNYSAKYPKLGELFKSDSDRDQMRAALTVKMVEQTEEFINQMNEINEAVTQHSLGRLNRKVLDVVRIFYPNLIAHELVDIQTLPGQIGDVYTVVPRFGDTAGLNFVDGDGNPVTTPEIFKHRIRGGHETPNRQPSYSVQGEGSGGGMSRQDTSDANPARHSLTYAAVSIDATATTIGVLPGAANQVVPTNVAPTNDANTSRSRPQDYFPIRPGTFRLRIGTAGDPDATLEVMDNGSGALIYVDTDTARAGTTVVTSGDYSHGYVNYETGAIYLNIAARTGRSGTVPGVVTAVFNTAGYTEMDSDLVGGAVNANTLPRRVEINIQHKTVKAQMYPLQVDYSIGASLAAKAHLGVDVNDTVSELAAHYIKWERDNLLTYAIRQNVVFPTNAQITGGTIPNGSVGFNITTSTEISRRDRFGDFMITVDEAESQIQRQTGRGRVDWILCGNNVANVIRQGRGFQASNVSAPIGPHVIGTLRNGTITVIKDIHMNKNNFVCGYRGYMAGDAAIILAEWIPIYFTPPHQSATMTVSQGIMSAYDLILNNADYLVGGAIANY